MNDSAGTTPIVIVGCGGFGREVHDVLDAINAVSETWDLLGYVDDSPTDENLRLVQGRGSRLLGGSDWLAGADAGVAYVLGIGSPKVKALLDERYGDRPAAVLVHPTATMGHDVELGPGTVICAGVRLTTNIRLGRHVHVNLNCTVGHDVEIGDHVSINPLVAISGNVTIGRGVMFGTHSCILQGLEVGEGSTVGGAAMVVKNVPADIVVKGIPAR